MIRYFTTRFEIETNVVDLSLFADKPTSVFVVLVMFPGIVLPGEARTREIDHRFSPHGSDIGSLSGNQAYSKEHYRNADTGGANAWRLPALWQFHIMSP
jgi:hypothetical protein